MTKPEPPYVPMVIDGINVEVKQVETLVVCRSPAYHGFMVTARTIAGLSGKVREAMTQFEEFLAGREKDRQVLVAFAKLLSEELACTTSNVGFNENFEKVLALEAARTMLASIWPHDFATEDEMAQFQKIWDAQHERLKKEAADDENAENSS